MDIELIKEFHPDREAIKLHASEEGTCHRILVIEPDYQKDEEIIKKEENLM